MSEKFQVLLVEEEVLIPDYDHQCQESEYLYIMCIVKLGTMYIYLVYMYIVCAHTVQY